jgi:hypothetical protein
MKSLLREFTTEHPYSAVEQSFARKPFDYLTCQVQFYGSKTQAQYAA